MSEKARVPRWRLAIIGGGLAGVTLANALMRHEHIEFHVYESAPEFSERGGAVGLATNAQQALHRVIPEADAMLKRTGGVQMNSTRIVVGAGPSIGCLVLDITPTDPGIIIHCASLLRELLGPIHQEVLHANKKVSSISESDSDIIGRRVEVNFTDGTTDFFDAVVGADGIFGTVRECVLREFPDAEGKYKASPAGFWDCRNLIPIEKAKAALGEEYFESDRQYGWVNDGALIIHDVLENRTMVQCIVSAMEKDPPKEGAQTALIEGAARGGA